jgi:hypothetical protein
MLTRLEKQRIKNFNKLGKDLRWRMIHIAKKRMIETAADLQFLLENKESIGSMNEIIGKEQINKILNLLIADLGIESSILSPDFAVSIIEENRVLSDIISKKNRVWRDLVAKVNTARNLEEFVNKNLDQDSVYLVDDKRIRVHVRK